MKIGILTSGGDCPGLNAVIRGAVPYEGAGGGPESIQRMLDDNGIDAIVVIGGEGTLTAAGRLSDAGIKIVGVPKTIDNDIEATDYSFGFDTAVQIATEAIDRLRTTAESHGRCMVLEVMGRNVGWIALHAGMAGGAHAILIPERSHSIEQICEWVVSVRDRGRAPTIVVSEGFTLDTMAEPHSHLGVDAFDRPRFGGIGDLLAPMIEQRTGIESRSTVLGHQQRGGVPSAYDRVLATRLGMAAIDSVMAGDWGSMVAVRGRNIVRVSIASAVGELNRVPAERYEEAALLFG